MNKFPGQLFATQSRILMPQKSESRTVNSKCRICLRLGANSLKWIIGLGNNF